MARKYDFLVIGGGIAGISCALKAAKYGKVALLCKTTLDESNTSFAQGGIAAVTSEEDSFENHIQDTLIAGDGHCRLEAVKQVICNAPAQIQELINWKVDFDKNEQGAFDLHREGGHGQHRILHHKDNTGFEIQQSLNKQVRQHPNITNNPLHSSHLRVLHTKFNKLMSALYKRKHLYGSDIFAPPRRGRGPRSGRGSLKYIASFYII